MLEKTRFPGLSCLRDLTLNHFGTVPACDRQTDGLTDRQTHNDSIYRASIASSGKMFVVTLERLERLRTLL